MNNHSLSPVWSHLTKIVPSKGKGAYLFDDHGEKYLDFTCGIGVTNTGHCHPKVTEAIQKQAKKLIFGQINTVISKPAIELSNNLNKVTPANINQFFFSNSGAEAVEASIKLSKHATSRSNIIVFQGSFHGRTHLAMAMTTAKTGYRLNYQPLPSGIFTAPFPSAFHYGWDQEKTSHWCINQLEFLLKSQTAPEETAAIIIEPVLGEGGYIPAPLSFLKSLRKICNKYGILLIADEVQSGFGRTGKMFCFEHYGIQPDILVMAKGLGSGLPISAIGASSELMSRWMKGTHGGTYGGGSTIPLTAANATINIIINEKLIKNSEKQGKYLMKSLKSLKKRYPNLGDVRGLGLMIGTEFIKENGEPNPALTNKIQSKCLEKKLLLLSCGTYLNVIRWIPPLMITKSQIDEAVKIFSESLEEYE